MIKNRGIGFGIENLPRIVRGEGSYLFDDKGRRYLDGSGGPAAFCIGHANREVNAAITAQLEKVACGYRYLFTSDALEQLTQLLLSLSGPDFGHVVYTGSGSESIESALKVALQYYDARELPAKRHFIARQRSYHGNTLGALSISGYTERRAPFEGSLLDVSFVSAANAYRPPAGVSEDELTGYLADELEAKIQAVGPDRVAAFIFEPVVGAAGGVVPAPPGYAQAVRQVCSRYDVLLIADEVMSGVGRCGTWRALEHDGISPDIMSIAKGLAGGYIPLGATVFKHEVGDTILQAQGGIMTGSLRRNWRHTRPGFFHRPRIRTRSRHETTVSGGPSRQPRGRPARVRERSDLLPMCRQRRRGTWRHGDHCAALQCHRQ